MSEPEIRQMPIGCDFCAHPGVPLWRYDIPPGTTLLATYDPVSKATNVTKSHGSLGACDPCDTILSAVRELAPGRIARRTIQLPLFQTMTPEQRNRSKMAWKKQLTRFIPLLTNRRKNVQGEDPMDGLGLFSKVDL